MAPPCANGVAWRPAGIIGRFTVPAYCLSIHAKYQCGHSGVCCTAGWSIPLEAVKVLALRTRHLSNVDTRRLPLLADGQPHVILPTNADGSCVFYDAAHGQLCAIHRDAGPDLLPIACSSFPRVALRDPRGVFVTLSHFCPTAARLLLSIDAIEIVEAPEAISLHGAVEGLDATAVMPPLLHRTMLTDWEGYSTWEREAIGVLNDRTCTARRALAIVRDATRDASGWKPGCETLSARMCAAFECARATHTGAGGEDAPFERPLKGFLAAHLFANWAAYQSGGLGAVVTSVERSFALVGERHTDEASFLAAVRQADLRLRHHA